VLTEAIGHVVILWVQVHRLPPGRLELGGVTGVDNGQHLTRLALVAALDARGFPAWLAPGDGHYAVAAAGFHALLMS
jgi:hypothetical protein